MRFRTIIPTLWVLTLLSCSASKEDSFFEKLDLVDMEGNTISLKEIEGKLAFINIWSTTCKPCLKEMPSIERAQSILEKEGYVFLAVSDEEPERIERFTNRFDYTFQIARYGLSMGVLGIYALPVSYIVNDKGEMLYKHIGAKEWDDEESLSLFRSYLKKGVNDD